MHHSPPHPYQASTLSPPLNASPNTRPTTSSRIPPSQVRRIRVLAGPRSPRPCPRPPSQILSALLLPPRQAHPLRSMRSICRTSHAHHILTHLPRHFSFGIEAPFRHSVSRHTAHRSFSLHIPPRPRGKGGIVRGHVPPPPGLHILRHGHIPPRRHPS